MSHPISCMSLVKNSIEKAAEKGPHGNEYNSFIQERFTEENEIMTIQENSYINEGFSSIICFRGY